MAGQMVPYSNPGGRNQTSPGMPTPIAAPSVPGTSLNSGANPFMPGAATPTGVGSVPTTAGAAGGNTGSLYNPASSYSSGETDIKKQLVDIYGKGTGGMLDYILQNMQGTDSAAFQQFLASMAPVEASSKASLGATLGAEGVGPNSSVNAIAQSNLEAQFNAQAAGVNSQMIQQQLQDTIGILQGTQGDASKEVASSGWDVLGQVLQGVGNAAGSVFGAAGAAGGFSSLFS